MKLPTAEEYAAMCDPTNKNRPQYSEPKYLCPVCGGGMCRDETLTVLHPIYPYHAMRQYVCDKCGHVDFQYR